MRKYYKISSRNSTVCGYPGRDFDWGKFCWDGSEIYTDKCHVFSCKHKHETEAPLPFVDDCLIAEGCEYLHVPYAWSEQCTIYRVRPNPTMYAGEIYRGHLVESVKAVKRKGVWYWLVESVGIKKG